MKIKVDNWLTFDNKNEWFNEIKESELNYYTDVYSPWQTKQRLKIWREVEGGTNLWTPYVGSFTITATWNISITWIWFTPSYVRFDLVHNNGFGSWNMTKNNQNSISLYAWASNTRCIDIYNNLWIIQTRAVYVSMDPDWFTINVEIAIPTLTVNFIAYP